MAHTAQRVAWTDPTFEMLVFDEAELGERVGVVYDKGWPNPYCLRCLIQYPRQFVVVLNRKYGGLGLPHTGPANPIYDQPTCRMLVLSSCHTCVQAPGVPKPGCSLPLTPPSLSDTKCRVPCLL